MVKHFVAVIGSPPRTIGTRNYKKLVMLFLSFIGTSDSSIYRVVIGCVVFVRRLIFFKVAIGVVEVIVIHDVQPGFFGLLTGLITPFLGFFLRPGRKVFDIRRIQHALANIVQLFIGNFDDAAFVEFTGHVIDNLLKLWGQRIIGGFIPPHTISGVLSYTRVSPVGQLLGDLIVDTEVQG